MQPQAKQEPHSCGPCILPGKEGCLERSPFYPDGEAGAPEEVILNEGWRKVRETAMQICDVFQTVSRGRRVQSERERVRG